MAVSRPEIKRWFQEGIAQGATHLIVMCDTFDWDDYPVFVMPGQNARDEAEQRNGKNMQRLMEVYNLSKDMEEQLKQHRVFNYD